MINKLMSGVLALSFSLPALSTVDCRGTINDIAVSRFGEIRLKTSFKPNQWFTVCKLDGSWNNISTDTCKMWASEIQLAYAAEKDVSIYYPDGTDCANMPSYEDAFKPDWVILRK